MGFSESKVTRYFAWLLLTAAVAWLKLGYHEMWKDEWQAWFVAKDMSLSQILRFLYYEGHPALWYLYLKPFTLLASDQVWMLAIAHLLTVAGALYFILVRFRTPMWMGLLFVLSYFVFFEYGIVSRGYALVILFVFWATLHIRDGKPHQITSGIVVFLLCQTEVFGVLMALALTLYLFLTTQDRKSLLTSSWAKGLAAGILVFTICVFPRSSGHIARTHGKTGTLSDQLLNSIQGNLSNTFFPGSTPDTFRYGWTFTGLVLSIAALAGLWYMFRKNRPLLYTMLALVVMMTTFSFVIFPGGIRQWGMSFVFLICMTELLCSINTKPNFRPLVVAAVFSVFALVHGFKAVREDILIPFSNAREAGLFISEKVPVKVPVVALNKFESTPVIGYAGRKFFELPDGKEFSYFRWVDKVYVPTEEEIKLFGKFKGVGGVVIISPKPIDTLRYPSAKAWKSFTSTNFKNENYYLYSLPVK